MQTGLRIASSYGLVAVHCWAIFVFVSLFSRYCQVNMTASMMKRERFGLLLFGLWHAWSIMDCLLFLVWSLVGRVR